MAPYGVEGSKAACVSGHAEDEKVDVRSKRRTHDGAASRCYRAARLAARLAARQNIVVALPDPRGTYCSPGDSLLQALDILWNTYTPDT